MPGTTVGATNVKVMPDTTGFGPQLQIDLGRIKPVINIGLKLAPTQPIKVKLDALAGIRTVRIDAKLTGDSAVSARLDQLSADRTVKIGVELDIASRDRVKQQLTTGLTGQKLKIGVELDQASVTRFKNQLALAIKNKLVIKVMPELDYASVVQVRTALNNLAQNRRVVIDVSDRGTATASAAIDRAARDRRSTISVGVNTGNSDRALGDLLGSLGNLKALALTSLPTLASVGQALVAMAPAAALAAPAIAGVGSALVAVKLGTAGIGDALKAAFSSSTADANRATSAAKGVESAQRSLATAVRGVATAEKDLTTAQRSALAAQQALTAAREQGRRELQDMNNNLKDAQLAQRQAVLSQQQAAKQLAADKAKGSSATAAQLAADQLSYDQATQQLLEQQQQVQRLTVDTAAANKKGIAGTQAMTAAQKQVADANQTVIDKQGALTVAQQGVKTAADAVADAQQAAAAQTSALSKAMAKLSPNARAFVTQVVALGPAWQKVQLGVQDRLLAGIGTRITGLARTVLPTLRTGLTGVAGVLNLTALNALGAVKGLQQTGLLAKIFGGAATGLRPLASIPGQIVTAFGQITVAAQPAFNKLTAGVGNVATEISKRLTGLFKSGELTADINVAVGLFKQLFQLAGSVFTIIKNVLTAASSAGSNVLGVLGQTVAEIARISAMPSVQAAIKSIFSALAQVGKVLSGSIGTAIKALLPILAAIAPPIARLATALGPVLGQLAGSLGSILPVVGLLFTNLNPVLRIALILSPVLGQLISAVSPVLVIVGKLFQLLGQALTPIIKSLAPVLKTVFAGIGQIISALLPLFAPISAVLTALVKAFAPIINVIVKVIVSVVKALSGPLATIIAALVPVITLIGTLISGVLGALMPVITPLLAIITAVANVLATVFSSAITALLPALTPVIGLITTVVTILAQLLSAVLTPLTPVITLVGGIISTILGVALKALTPLITTLSSVLGRLLGDFKPLFPVLGQLVTAVLGLIGPLLQLDVAVLTPLLPVITAVAGLLVKGLGAALQFLIPIVVKVISWIVEFVTQMVKAVTSIISWFMHLFDVLLGHSIIPDIVNGIVGWFTGLWHACETIFSTIAGVISGIWTSIWDGIKSVAAAAWGLVKAGFDSFAATFQTAFGLLRDGIGQIWGGVKKLFSDPIKFLVQTVYDQGIRTVWNATAGKIGLGDLPNVVLPKGFATGGIMPGYTPGRDVHLVPSVSGPVALSGGEAIMRPEWTRAVGPAYVHTANAIARTSGVEGIRDFLGLQGFDGGGIFGEVTHVIAEGVDWARQGIADLAEAAFAPVRALIDHTLGGSAPGSWGDSARLLPETTITKAIAYIRGQEDTTGAGAGISALHVAEMFKGVEYLWGGESPTGFDCSGLMQYAYQHGPHIAIPRTSQVQQGYTVPVTAAAAQAGDLVFFGRPAHHVGMWVKPGIMIDAPHTGAVVREEPLGAYTSLGRVPGIDALVGRVAGGAGVAVLQAEAQSLLGSFGWGQDQFAPLNALWNRESGWNPLAKNPTSGAYGIPQALPPSKMASVGPDWLTNPFTQEKWGLGYIKGRYGSPAAAWAHELQLGWYADGGFPTVGGLSVVGENGPELVRFGGPTQVYPSDVTARMAREMAGVVSGTAAAGRSSRQVSTVNNGGPRTLEYNATVREVASRQSIQDALAYEELLHRNIIVGG